MKANRFVFLAILVTASAEARELRVCADPNNLPFSNEKGEGFENRLAEIIARDLNADLTYTWWAQRRGFIRNTLKAQSCDLVPGFPSRADMLRVTAPYYRSTYVFITRADSAPVTSLDDPRLRQLKIGVQLIGNDGMNTPPAHALANRGVIDNVRGYSVYGDYAQPSPPRAIIDAVATGDVDVAIAWGPTAGYFAQNSDTPLRVTPVTPAIDATGLPMTFAISMGVRKDDESLLKEVSASLERHKDEIADVLAAYHVPLVSEQQASGGN